MSRFFVDATAVGAENIEIRGGDVKHISKVLRMRVGDTIEVSDSSEWEYVCEIAEIEQDYVLAKICDKQRFAREPELEITLFQGVPKGDKFESIIQKTTEEGVCAIVPVFMARSVVKDNGKYDKKIARYQEIATAAAKQCGRGRIPEICDSIDFKDIRNYFSRFDAVLMPYEDEAKTTIKEVLRELIGVKRLAIIIGPEGGFATEEANTLVEMGARSVSLGKTILRTETAGPAAIAMCMYELEM